MTEKDGRTLYTFKEVVEILAVGYKRIAKAMDEHILVPTEIEQWRGRQGFRYLFSADEIERYAEKVGLNPMWERAGMHAERREQERQERIEHQKSVMDARREVRKVIDPRGSDEIRITADNVHEIFGQSKSEDPIIEETEYYFVKIGKSAYITASRYLSDKFVGSCMMQKDCAEKMAEIYGGKVMRVCAREAI